jgi:hypothetical protein
MDFLPMLVLHQGTNIYSVCVCVCVFVCMCVCLGIPNFSTCHTMSLNSCHITVQD